MIECPDANMQCNDQCPNWKACIAENLEARENYDEDGTASLIHGVLKWAIKDWANASTPEARQKAEAFFYSPYFGSLTGMDGKTFLEQLKKRMEEKKKNARKGANKNGLHG